MQARWACNFSLSSPVRLNRPYTDAGPSGRLLPLRHDAPAGPSSPSLLKCTQPQTPLNRARPAAARRGSGALVMRGGGGPRPGQGPGGRARYPSSSPEEPASNPTT